MTRRGTLAYYLAAWVVGCFIAAALFSSTAETVRVSMFLVTYFFALMGGLAGLLLFAFFLRLAMRLLGTHSLWIWAAAGAGIFSALVFLLAMASEKRPEAWWTGVPLTISNLFFAGARAVRRTGFWQAPIDGAVTAAVLCLVDRAFNRSD
jgi:hypothetical protein